MSNWAKTFETITTTATITRFRCEYTWTIQNFKSNFSEPAVTMDSPLFSAAENTCKLFLQFHSTRHDDKLRLYLEVADKRDIINYGRINGEFECLVTNSAAKGRQIKIDKGYFHLTTDNHFFEFENLSYNLSELPDNDAKIYCIISYIHDLNFAALRDQSDTFLLSKVHAVADLEKLLNDEKFSDITVYVGSKKFSCHKSILAARSSVFEAMLTHDMKEKNLNRIDIDDIDENIFQEVLRYIYTGKVMNIEKIAFELLLVASKYDLTMLMTICESELYKTITVETAVKILSISNALDLKTLKIQVIEYIQTNLKKMIGSDAWNELISQPDLMKIVLEAYGNECSSVPNSSIVKFN